jgi:hypothetical protein
MLWYSSVTQHFTALSRTESPEDLLDVVVSSNFGQFWLGRALYGVWQSAAVPLLKHFLSMTNHVQPRAWLKIGLHVFKHREKAASYHG